MTLRRIFRLALGVAVLAPLAAPAAAQLPQTEYEGATALGVALRRLGTTKRVLMVGAHPDDESTQILSTLALGQGAQVAYLSLTRGEGGQNGIGPELQEALGLLRTEELLSARRLDGARQYFTRAYDYGFSKNAEEAFAHWPREEVLRDAVAAVRHFRPDVILAVFSGTPADGHGQHQASGIIAREAFLAAGDPARFPEQIARGLRPHAPEKIYQALWRSDATATEELATGAFDPLLGRSYYQAAMESRSRHRSQDMGQILQPGPHASSLRLVGTRGGRDLPETLFGGVDTLLSQRVVSLQRATDDQAPQRVAALVADYERRVAAARERFNPFAPERAAADLAAALQALAAAERLAAGLGPEGAELHFRIREERAETEDALWRASGVALDALAGEETVVPGQEFALALTLWNGGREAVAVDSLAPRLPAGWKAEPLDALPAEVAPGALLTRRFRVSVPADAALSEAYFLRRPRAGDLYAWTDETGGVGLPFQPAPVAARARVRVAGGTPVGAEREASFRGLDKMQGELRRPVRVVPAVAVRLEPALVIVPVGETGAARRFSVRLRSEAPKGVSGTLRLRVPAGWRVEPAEAPLSFSAEGEEQVRDFTVRPPAGARAGIDSVRAEFRAGEAGYALGYALIDYPHTRPQPLYAPAAASLRVLDVKVPAGLRVGYVAGPGDEVPAALEQLGVKPELLGPGELAAGDLAAYDVIVTGIRAYEVRPDLTTHNQRLLDYVRGGGTLIVQYNKYEFTEPGIAPYPLSMARPHDRVTDEAAPVRLLDPSHPVLAGPNRITAADFEGWVQERGLYHLREWDARYTPLLEMADPGEAPQRGSLVVAKYGEGNYVYTGLALFRQLPAGVPGAYRLFANLLALGENK